MEVSNRNLLVIGTAIDGRYIFSLRYPARGSSVFGA
jgi:hypothetical protein